jgi:AcrR family transcriptional regulator
MARWEPNARERLVRAAVDLFTEQGYDATTVTQIADRAGGLTKTTFFRHFPDKREVLFAGQELHVRLLADALAAAPTEATPLQAVEAALDALAASFGDDRRELAARLKVLIADNTELRERASFKHAILVEAVAGGLRQRGVADRTATIAGDIAMRAFDEAFAHWAEPGDQRSLAEHARVALEAMRNAVAELV